MHGRAVEQPCLVQDGLPVSCMAMISAALTEYLYLLVPLSDHFVLVAGGNHLRVADAYTHPRLTPVCLAVRLVHAAIAQSRCIQEVLRPSCVSRCRILVHVLVVEEAHYPRVILDVLLASPL